MTVSATPQEIRDAVLAILTEAAVNGERCPQLDNIYYHVEKRLGVRTGATTVPELARLGLIRIEISGRNWRVVEILEGPHKGARTAPSPRGGRPYLVIDAGGSRHQRRVRGRA